MSWHKWVSFSLLAVVINGIPQVFAADNKPGFAAAEHTVLGENVKLSFYASDPGSTHQLLQLPNGLQLTYGEITSLGDFYGTPGRPISEGETEQDRRALFLSTFIAFAETQGSINETLQLMSVVRDEQVLVTDGMKRGEKPEDIYQKISQDYNRKFNCITGGGCDDNWWMEPGRYLELAKSDVDHFSDNAVMAYQTGHKLALEQAMYAHTVHDERQLEIAYAMNALASHYLADRFAAGHIRTPRAKLRQLVTPAVVGSLLVNYMHSEENKYGVHVHNLRGEHWIAYGDTKFFDAENNKNREILQEVMQDSADQIFYAYVHGYEKGQDQFERVLPQADYPADSHGLDIAPLFYYDSQANVIYRRTLTSDVNSYQWTTNWWGWSTLMQLARERGLPGGANQMLIQAGYGDEARRLGMI